MSIQNPRVSIQNVPVCTFKTSPCVPAPRAHVFQHSLVLRVIRRRVERTHGHVLNGQTEVLNGHTTPRQHHDNAHTHTTTHQNTPEHKTQHNTTTQHTTSHADRDRDRERERRRGQREEKTDGREKRRQKKTKQDKTGEDETRQECKEKREDETQDKNAKRRGKMKDKTKEDRRDKMKEKMKREMKRNKPFGRIIPSFFFESSESDRFFNYLHDSNSIFRVGGIKSAGVSARLRAVRRLVLVIAYRAKRCRQAFLNGSIPWASEEETALADDNDRKEAAKLGSQGWAQLRGFRGK